ncbi:MAG TPA: signal peptidase I, partial [Clostridia bacterium]|nr:signal peptidase I [Clostridia bacterium]
GDKVDIKNNHVYINNKVQKETYAKGNTYIESIDFPITVPKNKILVMGDNREESFDSRRFGLVSISRVRGKALFRIFPIKDFGNIYKNMK